MWRTLLISCISVGTFVSSLAAAHAAELTYNFSGNFAEEGSFFGSFSYDTEAENQAPLEGTGIFALLDFEVFVDDVLLLSSEQAEGTIARYSFTDVVTLEFGATVGIPEAPPPTGFLLELAGVGGNINEPPRSLATTDNVEVVNGFATSETFTGSVNPNETVITLASESGADTSESIPEPSTVLGLVLVGFGCAHPRRRS